MNAGIERSMGWSGGSCEVEDAISSRVESSDSCCSTVHFGASTPGSLSSPMQR